MTPISTASTGASAPVEWGYNTVKIRLSDEFLRDNVVNMSDMIQTMMVKSYRRTVFPWEFSDPAPRWKWDPFPRWTVAMNAYNRLRAKPDQWRESLAWRIMPYGEYDRNW